MASDPISAPSKAPPMTLPELVSFVKRDLDADEERQAQVTPASTTDLPTGSTLDLSHKHIKQLPVEVILLIRDRVERLALSHNPHITLPDEIAQCDRLRYLNLRWNELKHFPHAVLSLSKLEILDISKNAIDAIPEDIKRMTNLKFLAVARNQIRRLPLALADMNLVKLKFDENPIEFPPPDALQPPADQSASIMESEKDKEMCNQVKRFMKAAAAKEMREKLRSRSEEDLSESNVETPRPPKRGITRQRFPVRPSISGIDNIPHPSSESPPENRGIVPALPPKSHARVASSNNATQPIKRPSIAPLLTTGLDTSRSRSETVATTSNIRNRRQGYVPRKNAGLDSLTEMTSQLSARSTPTPALTPPHSRAPSSASNYLAMSSGGESSSGAVSPVDGSFTRVTLPRTLSSLPESRNSSVPTINSIKATKRVMLMLFYMWPQISQISQQLSINSPKKTNLQRKIRLANTQTKELDRLMENAHFIIEDNNDIDPVLLIAIIQGAVMALDAYAIALQEIRQLRQYIIKEADAFNIRCIINTLHGTTIEARNVCHILGFQTKSCSTRDTLRVSRAWSSRTVTPTQPKSAISGRRRGPTIVSSAGSAVNGRGTAPPVPLNNGSRSNTMTSISAAPFRYNELYPNSSPNSNLASRSNTMRSVITEAENESSADNLYLKLKACCDLAKDLMPPVRQDLGWRKADADRGGYGHASRAYAVAVNKCDLVISTNNKLLARLRTLNPGESVRFQREFATMSESFGKEWTTFINELSSMKRQGIVIGNNQNVLKSLHHAVKDANRAASHQALQPQSAKPAPSASLQGTFVSPGFSTSAGQSTGYSTPVSATPLGAALGPAVQATVPPPQSITTINSTEVMPLSAQVPQQSMRSRPTFDRTDTALPLPSYPPTRR